MQRRGNTESKERNGLLVRQTGGTELGPSVSAKLLHFNKGRQCLNPRTWCVKKQERKIFLERGLLLVLIFLGKWLTDL